MNDILFGCLPQPGLGYAVVDLLGFDGAAFQSRAVAEFPEEHKRVGSKVKDVALKWEDAVFAGVTGIGLAPPGDYVISADDRIILVSKTSMPTLCDAVETSSGKAALCVGTKPVQAKCVLICGWKPQWDDPSGYAGRLEEIADGLAPGSRVIHVSLKCVGPDAGSFQDFMNEVIKSSKSIRALPVADDTTFVLGPDVTLHRVGGDAADYAVLDQVIQNNVIDQALVLSSASDQVLSREARDTRVLSILIQLRDLQLKHKQPSMHVIAESLVDLTGLLAIGPPLAPARATSPQSA